jgi:hypothetical protein
MLPRLPKRNKDRRFPKRNNDLLLSILSMSSASAGRKSYNVFIPRKRESKSEGVSIGPSGIEIEQDFL